MTAQSNHLAQTNIAKMQAPMEHPSTSDFVARLDEINQLADERPGFVWRVQTDEGEPTARQTFPDPQGLVHLRWQSPVCLPRTKAARIKQL